MDLDGLYGQLPAMECKGLCWESCFSVGLMPVEQTRIIVKHGLKIETGFFEDGCPGLSPFRRCLVYADRPLICRLWGMVPSMRCPYGCEPTGGMLTEEQGQTFMNALWQIPAM